MAYYELNKYKVYRGAADKVIRTRLRRSGVKFPDECVSAESAFFRNNAAWKPGSVVGFCHNNFYDALWWFLSP